MPNEVTASSSTISGCAITFNYAEAKFKFKCTHCGFEDDLCAGYECPICHRGTMCRTTQDVMWYQDCNSSCAALQKGFYGLRGEYPALDSDALSAPIYDGYLFEEVNHMRRVEILADAYENEAIVTSTEELEAIYDDDVFEAMELQEKLG